MLVRTRPWPTRGPRGARPLALALALVVAVVACSSDDGASPSPSTTTTTAPSTTGGGAGPGGGSEGFPGEDWEIGDPESQGMDPAGLEAARGYAFAEGRNTQGVVVIRHGVIVGEWYADGAEAGSWAASWSVAKSFTSALVGIALEDGLIASIDESMATWYPEWAGTDHEEITLRDVLEMESGLRWNESYTPETAGESEIIAMVLTQTDQLAYASSREVEVPPGERWSYSSGDTMLLSGVIEAATGMSVAEYAQAELFDPIGMEPVEWWSDVEGHTLTYCCLDTSSRGFARLGLLYLNGGRWGEDQVVPDYWVRDSLTGTEPSQGGYGFQWWLDTGDVLPDGTFSAQGHDGQYIYVVPELDLVVVRNGTYVKDDGPPVADPNLFSVYPPSGLVEGAGTTPPDEWDDQEFLLPIVEAVTD